MTCRELCRNYQESPASTDILTSAGLFNSHWGMEWPNVRFYCRPIPLVDGTFLNETDFCQPFMEAVGSIKCWNPANKSLQILVEE